MGLVGNKMSAATFLKSSLFAKQLYTFSKISQASIKINITNLDKLDNFVETLISFIKLDKLDRLW